MKKKYYIIIIIVLVILIAILSCLKLFSNNDTEKNENNNLKLEYNNTQELLKEQEVNGLLFTNISCTWDGENSIIYYTIINKTSETIHLNEYELVIKDKDGVILTTVHPNYDYDLASGEQFPTGNAVNINLMSAYSLELNLENID